MKFQPKAATRRSKEERDAIERAEKERAAIRQPGEEASGAIRRRGQAQRSNVSGRRAVERSGRAGSGRGEIRDASGPLGASVARPQRTRTKPSQNQDGHASQGETPPANTALKNKRPSRVKRETADKNGIYQEDGLSTDGTKSAKRKRSSKVKKENDTQVELSSEDELDSDTVKKINVERISLVSSEEDENLAEPHKVSSVSRGKQREASPNSRNWMMRPVFMERQEHIERNPALSTDASFLSSAELRRRAKARHEANGSLFLSDDEEITVPQNVKSKTRRKPKDVEFLRDERKWKGVWVANDDSDDVQVKAEPEEDENAVSAENSTGTVQPESESMELVLDDDQVRGVDTKSTQQSEDDGEDGLPLVMEYYQIQDDFAMSSLHRRVFEDSGDDRFADFVTEDGETAVDSAQKELRSLQEQYRAEHTHNTTEKSNGGSHQNADNSHYHTRSNGQIQSHLIQLPPLVPSLREYGRRKSSIKTEKRPLVQVGPSDIENDEAIEEEPSNKHLASSQEPERHSLYTQATSKLIYGEAGDFTFYASGKILATWGGVTLEIKREVQPSGQAREVFVTEHERVITKEEKGNWEEMVKLGGQSKSGSAVGSVKSTFVGTPEWATLLG